MEAQPYYCHTPHLLIVGWATGVSLVLQTFILVMSPLFTCPTLYCVSIAWLASLSWWSILSLLGLEEVGHSGWRRAILGWRWAKLGWHGLSMHKSLIGKHGTLWCGMPLLMAKLAQRTFEKEPAVGSLSEYWQPELSSLLILRPPGLPTFQD